jgi:hypothetical protein
MAKASKRIVPLLFQKSVNNGHSSKFSLASKQGEKRFKTHLFPSLVGGSPWQFMRNWLVKL